MIDGNERQCDTDLSRLSSSLNHLNQLNIDINIMSLPQYDSDKFGQLRYVIQLRWLRWAAKNYPTIISLAHEPHVKRCNGERERKGKKGVKDVKV